MTVTVKKVGGSMSVVIPMRMAKEMRLTEGTSLEIRATQDSIVMQKRQLPARRSLKSIVSQIKPATYRRRRLELGQDQPIGKENWRVSAPIARIGEIWWN